MAEGSYGLSMSLPQDSARNVAFLVENTYRDIIIKNVRCGDLLPHMCIPERDQKFYNEILALENRQQQREACGLFLDYLRTRAEQKDYQLFLQLLEGKGYRYVAKLLRGENSLDPEIYREQCRLIQFFSHDITSRIDLDLMYPKLIEDDWIDEEDGQHLKIISANGGRIQAARWLVLVILPRRKVKWFQEFLQLLWSYGHQDLVVWIDEHFNKSLKSPEATGQDDDTGSEKSFGDAESASVNVLSASGDAHSSLDVMEEPISTYMVRSAGTRPARGKTSLFETDSHRLANWIPTYTNPTPSTTFIRENTITAQAQGTVATSDICQIGIGNNRHVTVSRWKGSILIHIREYYQKDERALPSKIGIALTPSEWKTLSNARSEVNRRIADVIAKKGVNMSTHLGANVYVSVDSKYPGVGIRGFWKCRYTQCLKPSRKGIHLSFEQWNKVCNCFDTMHRYLAELENIASC